MTEELYKNATDPLYHLLSMANNVEGDHWYKIKINFKQRWQAEFLKAIEVAQSKKLTINKKGIIKRAFNKCWDAVLNHRNIILEMNASKTKLMNVACPEYRKFCILASKKIPESIKQNIRLRDAKEASVKAVKQCRKVLEEAFSPQELSALANELDCPPETDLPPKKWTQRRDGFSIKASSKMGGVQWKGKTEKRDGLTGSLRFQQSRWS